MLARLAYGWMGDGAISRHFWCTVRSTYILSDVRMLFQEIDRQGNIFKFRLFSTKDFFTHVTIWYDYCQLRGNILEEVNAFNLLQLPFFATQLSKPAWPLSSRNRNDLLRFRLRFRFQFRFSTVFHQQKIRAKSCLSKASLYSRMLASNFWFSDFCTTFYIGPGSKSDSGTKQECITVSVQVPLRQKVAVPGVPFRVRFTITTLLLGFILFV